MLQDYKQYFAYELAAERGGRGHPVSIALEVVVKGELLASLYIFLCEKSNGKLSLHQPLLGLTVGHA